MSYVAGPTCFFCAANEEKFGVAATTIMKAAGLDGIRKHRWACGRHAGDLREAFELLRLWKDAEADDDAGR